MNITKPLPVNGIRASLRRGLPLSLFLACLAVLGPACARAQPLPEPQFVQTLTNNSIMDGVVTAVVQDAQGYIWAGGATGLARYDGYHFVRFPLQAGPGDAEVISSVSAIVPMRDGRLLVGLGAVGLVVLDPRTGRSVFYRHDPNNAQSLANGFVRAVVSDGADGYWVATLGGGLDHFDPATGTFVHSRVADGRLPSYQVGALLLDHRGDLWVGGAAGLVRKARSGAGYQRILSDPRDEARLARQKVSALQEDQAGRVWVGTTSGALLIVEPDSGRAVWLTGEDSVADGAVNTLVETDGNQMWVGRFSGVEVRAADSGALRQRIRHVAGRIGALAAPIVGSIVRDRSGVLFFGLYGGGVQRYVPPLPGIFVHRLTLRNPSDGMSVRSIAEMRNGEIWLGRGEQGIALVDQSMRTIAEFSLSDLPGWSTSQPLSVNALAQGRDGHVWAGTNNGVYEFDEGRHFLRRYDMGGTLARCMRADPDGTLWVGTNNGLLRLAPGAAALAPVLQAQGGLLSGNVDGLVLDPAGRLWVGNAAGVFWIDRATNMAHKLLAAPVAADGNYAVKGLLADADGLWIDSDGGRYRVDRIDGVRARYTLAIDSKGAAGHAIGANLLRDQRGRVWTHRGMHDPATGHYEEFTVADGVDMGTGWFRSYTQLRDGRMLFGGSTGLLQVEPDKFKPWSYRPPVVLTALSVNGQAVAIPATGGITIAPPRRALRAEFSSLDYSAPERNRYRYRLLGYDQGWREAEATLRVASYDNLPPGDYTLQVQGSNRHGLWSEAMATLAVTILPAWWETWWARLGMLVLGAAAVAGVVQWRTYRLRQREEELALRVAARTAELQEVSAALAAKSRALEMASLTDPLTGLHNRRFLTEYIDADVAQSIRRHEDSKRSGGEPADDADLVFFLIDIDHFKQVNDQYGHAAGDAVLSQMPARLRAIFRESDYVIRWGGEEFLVVVRGARRQSAAVLAERARAAVANAPFVLPDGRELPKTCSIGYACFPLSSQFPRIPDWQAVGEVADAALYQVKNGGRNGWCGVTAVHAPDQDDLQHLLRQPLAEWAETDWVTMQHSRHGADALAHAG